MLNVLPADYLTINSALLEAPPSFWAILPFLHNDEVIGVIELGGLNPFTEPQRAFLNAALDAIAIALNTTLDRTCIEELLAQTQQQAEELQTINATLSAQT